MDEAAPPNYVSINNCFVFLCQRSLISFRLLQKTNVSLALNNLWPPETVLQSCCPLLHDVNKSSVLQFPSVLSYVRPYHISLVKRYHKSIKHERCFGRDDNFHHVVFNILCIIYIIYFSCIPSTVLNLTQWMCFIKQ